MGGTCIKKEVGYDRDTVESTLNLESEVGFFGLFTALSFKLLFYEIGNITTAVLGELNEHRYVEASSSSFSMLVSKYLLKMMMFGLCTMNFILRTCLDVFPRAAFLPQTIPLFSAIVSGLWSFTIFRSTPV